jgi:hypothetical protein
MWRGRLAPEGKAFPGGPPQLEQKFGTTAELASFGKKWLGVSSWHKRVVEASRSGVSGSSDYG